MGAFRLPAHDENQQQPASERQQPNTTPESDIAYMGGSAEDIDKMNPLMLISVIFTGIAMWGVIIAGLVAIF